MKYFEEKISKKMLVSFQAFLKTSLTNIIELY